MSDDAFIENHVLPALHATEVKAQLYEGEWKISPPLISWGPRVATNRLIAEMKGMLVKEQESPNAQVKVIIVNEAFRPKRPVVTIPVIPGIALPAAKEERK